MCHGFLAVLVVGSGALLGFAAARLFPGFWRKVLMSTDDDPGPWHDY